jgi:hypothetical protein
MTQQAETLQAQLAGALERLERLERASRDLQDLRELTELVVRYQRMCDGGWDRKGSHRDAEGLAGLFTEDGEYSINPERPPCHGREQVEAQFVRLQSSLPWIIHYLTNLDFSLEGDRASGEVKCIGRYLRDGKILTTHGLYEGRFTRTADGWRFVSWLFVFADTAGVANTPS